ncbi:MAG: hypothetical protein ACYS5V_09870, partial [Planctomycetota bacterium]
MKRVSPYLKMRVLGAIEFAPGTSIRQRIQHVSTMVFADEAGQPFQFTWRTIQTWYSRYQKHGITSMQPKPRSDKGQTRKVLPEQLQEAIEQVLPAFHGQPPSMAPALSSLLIRRDEGANAGWDSTLYPCPPEF